MGQLLRTLTEVSLGVSAVAAALLLLRPLLGKRYAPRMFCLVWAVLALRLLVPFKLPAPAAAPVLAVPVSRQVVYTRPAPPAEPAAPAAVQTTAAAAQTQTPAAPAAVSRSAAAEPTLPQSLTLTEAAALVWLAGSAVLATGELVCYWRERRRLLRRARPNDEAQALCNLLAARRHLRAPRVCEVQMACGPMLVGYLRPVILLPQDGCNQNELEMILCHELTHLRRGDVWTKLLLSAAVWVHWPNPIVWLMRRAACEDIELACDAAVVRYATADYRAAYSESIVSSLRCSRKLLGSSSFASSRRTVTRRIRSVFDRRPKRRGLALAALVLAASVAAGSFVACSSTAPSEKASAFAADGAATTAISQKEVQDFVIPQQVTDLVSWCEWGAIGSRGWPGKNDADANYTCAVEIAMALLSNSSHLQETAVYYDNGELDGYRVTPQELNKYLKLFTGEEHGFDPSTLALTFGPDINTVEPVNTLEPVTQKLTDGGNRIMITYRRVPKNGIGPTQVVTYVFRKAQVQTVPELLAADYPLGSTVWQLESCTNQTPSTPPPGRTVEIATAEQLAAAAAEYNADGWTNANNTYQLTADIDLAGQPFEMMGTFWTNGGQLSAQSLKTGFSATFDGGGHTIRNLTIDESYTAGSRNCVGLFAIIGQDGVVKNLRLENALVVGAVDDQYRENENGEPCAGLLAGDCFGTVENCTVQGTVEGHASVGGLIGTASYEENNDDTGEPQKAQVTNCTADVKVSGGQQVGGLIGKTYGADVINCRATGTVTGIRDPILEKGSGMSAFPWNIGGFVGTSAGTLFQDCRVDTSLVIRVNGRMIGYFIGDAGQGDSITGCTYTAAKKGNWQLIDTLLGIDPTAKQLAGFDLTPV